MNKQELIEVIKNEPYERGIFVDTIKFNRNWLLRKIEQLDEPQKVIVPQFVADWIENCKRGLSLRQAISQVHVGIEVDDWLMEVDADGAFVNQDAFARAWLDGYEVEEEKQYRISMPKARNYKNHAQILCEKDGEMFWCGEWYSFRAEFTSKELEEAGFGWVFDCPGIEIEEVE